MRRWTRPLALSLVVGVGAAFAAGSGSLPPDPPPPVEAPPEDEAPPEEYPPDEESPPDAEPPADEFPPEEEPPPEEAPPEPPPPEEPPEAPPAGPRPGSTAPPKPAGTAAGPGITGGSARKIPPEARRQYKRGRAAIAEADKRVEAARAKKRPADNATRRAQLAKAKAGYRSAKTAMEAAVAADPALYQAWNMLGYARRKLGEIPAALDAYGKALELKPGYPPALEYRAQAYLAQDRVDEAKAAYMKLFRDQRPLAKKLHTAMARWVQKRRRKPGKTPKKTVDKTEAWLIKRARLAKQAPAGSGASGAW